MVTSLPRGAMLTIFNVLVAVTIAYLAVCTLYIFLYQVRVEDNRLVFNILAEVSTWKAHR